MASNRSQMFACLVVLGCLASLVVALPTPQEEDSGRSADEAKDQPKIEPANKAGLTRPWSVPQLQQNAPAQSDHKEKRSADQTSRAPASTTASPTKGSYVTKPVESVSGDKKDKRETRETLAPARLPSNTPATPSKLNTPSVTRPQGTTSNKKDKRSPVEPTTRQPWQARTEVTTEQARTSARPVPLPFIPSKDD